MKLGVSTSRTTNNTTAKTHPMVRPTPVPMIAPIFTVTVSPVRNQAWHGKAGRALVFGKAFPLACLRVTRTLVEGRAAGGGARRRRHVGDDGAVLLREEVVQRFWFVFRWQERTSEKGAQISVSLGFAVTSLGRWSSAMPMFISQGQRMSG